MGAAARESDFLSSSVGTCRYHYIGSVNVVALHVP